MGHQQLPPNSYDTTSEAARGPVGGAAVNCLAVSGLQGCNALLGSTGEGPIGLGFFRGKLKVSQRLPSAMQCPPIKNSVQWPTEQVPVAVFLERLATPWRKEANWRLEDSKTPSHCVMDGDCSVTAASHPFLPQGRRLLANHHAVRGLVGPMPANYRIRLGGAGFDSDTTVTSQL